MTLHLLCMARCTREKQNTIISTFRRFSPSLPPVSAHNFTFCGRRYFASIF